MHTSFNLPIASIAKIGVWSSNPVSIIIDQGCFLFSIDNPHSLAPPLITPP